MSKSAIKFGTGKMNLDPAPINPDWMIEALAATDRETRLSPAEPARQYRKRWKQTHFPRNFTKSIVRLLPQLGIGHGRSCTEHARRKCGMHHDVARRRRQRMSSADAGRASIDAVRHKALISQLKTLCLVIPRCSRTLRKILMRLAVGTHLAAGD
jgi:hypothetical protein